MAGGVHTAQQTVLKIEERHFDITKKTGSKIFQEEKVAAAVRLCYISTLRGLQRGQSIPKMSLSPPLS